ncbi:MAG: hypothetical protein JAZ06_01650 [Candidatus Thiodiazotropha taylori]|nr:hypothetical protein [Candidatus Thiodiazotropha taylori]
MNHLGLWVIRIAIVLILLFLLSRCVDFFSQAVKCGEDSEAVLYARSLSQERLEKLYEDMERYSIKDNLPSDGYKVYQKDVVVPDEFNDLKVVIIRPFDGNIMIKGCMDHYVYLDFHGIGLLKEHRPERKIVLKWGEHSRAGSELLWRDNEHNQ